MRLSAAPPCFQAPLISELRLFMIPSYELRLEAEHRPPTWQRAEYSIRVSVLIPSGSRTSMRDALSWSIYLSGETICSHKLYFSLKRPLSPITWSATISRTTQSPSKHRRGTYSFARNRPRQRYFGGLDARSTWVQRKSLGLFACR
jgi:hypothetical protein